MAHKYALEIELTDFCPLQCGICINKNLSHKTFMKEEVFFQAVDYIKENIDSLYAIDLCGIGDIFLHPKVFEFLEHLKNTFGSSIPFIIPTKGFILKNEDFQKLQSLQEGGLRFVLSFGFFSMNRAIHDSLTGKQGSYGKILAGIDACRTSGINYSLELLESRFSSSRKEKEIFQAFAKKLEVGHRVHEFHNFGGMLKDFKQQNESHQYNTNITPLKITGSFEDDTHKKLSDLNRLRCPACMPIICADGTLYFCSSGAKIKRYSLGPIREVFHQYPSYSHLMEIISEKYISKEICKECSRSHLIRSKKSGKKEFS